METLTIGRPRSRELTTLELITFSQKGERRTADTYSSYARNLEAFLEEHNLTLQTLTPLSAKAFIQEMGKFVAGKGYEAINTAVAYKRFMRTLLTSIGRKDDSKWLRDNLKDIQPLNKFKVDIPTEQILKLIEVTQNDKANSYSPELALGWSLMAFDGLRPGEILGIYFGDVNKQSKTISLQRHEGERYFPKSTKVGEEPATIPLNDFSLSLFTYLPDMLSKRVIPISYKTMRKWFYHYAEKAEVVDREGNKVTPHKMRHVFGHLWRNNKGDLQVLKEIMRHSDIRITMIYSAPSTGEVNNEFEKTINNNIPSH
jgi:integrase